MNLLTNIFQYNNNLYLLEFNLNNNIYFGLSIQIDNTVLVLKIKHEILYDNEEYYEYEKSINFIINNKIAIYHKINIYDEYHGYNIAIYFKNIHPEILLQLL